MPELPEVETIRSWLEPRLERRTFRRIRIHKPDILLDGFSRPSFARRLSGRTVRRVERRAKNLLFRLDTRLVVQVQLRMTGRFALVRDEAPPAEFRHIAAEFLLDDGATLVYDDVRRLGGFRLLSDSEWRERAKRLGPEPLGRFRSADLESILGACRAPIKSALLNQRRIAGIGNIYASEALHRAGVDPRRPANSLTAPETRRLHGALRRVLREALASAGTTLRDYRAANGESGRYQSRLRVYGRAGEPCRRCKREIRRVVQSGRSSFYCPGCQG